MLPEHPRRRPGEGAVSPVETMMHRPAKRPSLSALLRRGQARYVPCITSSRKAMQLFNFFEKRRAERQPADIAVVARSRAVTGGWSAHIAAGDAVVADINEYGL